MRILFYGDRRGWTIACFVDHSLPSFFFSLPCLALPCLAVPSSTEEANQLRLCCYSSYISPPLPTFLFAAGRCIISSIVLNSLSQRHDNLYLSSKVKSSGPVACRLLRPVTVESKLHLFRSVLPPSPPSAVSGSGYSIYNLHPQGANP